MMLLQKIVLHARIYIFLIIQFQNVNYVLKYSLTVIIVAITILVYFAKIIWYLIRKVYLAFVLQVI